MFQSVLIANRGEIACRIIACAKKMNIKTICIYSEVDHSAQHVLLADEAYCIGPAPAAQSYLNIEKIISIAKQSGAEAIHPGYGFLSEDPLFSEQVAAAGIVFIGPGPDAMRMMADKTAAKKQAEKANIPVLTGYQVTNQSLDEIKQACNEMGYPLLIKARAGGGGKGMRLIHAADQLAAGIKATQREALTHFSDDRIFIESYIEHARHIEIQVVRDQLGNVIHLFDRECSLQRRHQKIIEEAPAIIAPELKERLYQSAIQLVSEINYQGVGTVEFLIDAKQDFYFIEMNTRLQVEHPVTEMITGVDLVQLQFLIANGQPLPYQQTEITLTGHAIEARVCAEDPLADWLPSPGKLFYCDFPQQQTGIRVDTGVRTGDRVSPYYDTLLAKLIVHADSRGAAITALRHALAQTKIVGVQTNCSILQCLLNQADYQNNTIYTMWLGQVMETLIAEVRNIPLPIIALTAHIYRDKKKQVRYQQQSNDQHSPWQRIKDWRLFGCQRRLITFSLNDQLFRVHADTLENHQQIIINEAVFKIQGVWETDKLFSATINNQHYSVDYLEQSDQATLFIAGKSYTIELRTTVHHQAFKNTAGNHLVAPMPGTLIEVSVQVGDQVKLGDPLAILEAMKMEHTLHAPCDATIKNITKACGVSVQEGDCVIELTTD